MVSFENGKFILRRRGDDRLHSSPLRSRLRSARRRILLVSALFAFFYLTIHRMNHQLQKGTDSYYSDLSVLRSAMEADVVPSSGRNNEANDSNSNEHSGDDDEERTGSRSIDASDADDESREKTNLHTGDSFISGSSDDNSNNQQKIRCPVTSLNKNFLRYLQSLPPIPKKIHTFFPDKDYWRLNANMPFVRHSVLALMDLNPDWNVTVYDDKMIDDIIRRAAYDFDLIEREEADILIGKRDSDGRVVGHSAHIVERSDIARLLLLYTEGGIYLDADRLVSIPLHEVLDRNKTKMCLPTFSNVNFCQDLMCTPPKNDLFLEVIRMTSNQRLQLERKNGWVSGGSLMEMGPGAYNERVFARVFNNDGRDNGQSLYDKCVGNMTMPQKLLVEQSDGVIVTKEEKSCNDGLLVDERLSQCYQRMALYHKYKMKSWAPEVDALWQNE